MMVVGDGEKKAESSTERQRPNISSCFIVGNALCVYTLISNCDIDNENVGEFMNNTLLFNRNGCENNVGSY